MIWSSRCRQAIAKALAQGLHHSSPQDPYPDFRTCQMVAERAEAGLLERCACADA